MALTKKTVLVLGAGASMPYGFPSGDELKQRIISSLKNFPTKVGPAPPLENLVNALGVEAYHVQDFRYELAHAPHVTIDRFLEIRPEFERIGKLAIAATLIPLEKDSVIPMFTPWESPPTVKQRVADGWYRYFAQQLNLSSTDWGGGLLTVITYNYDRSLEHFLFTILRSTCKESDGLCWEIFQQIPIIHVYGELGPYNPIGDGLRYGSSLNIEIARGAAKNIRIMHEAKNEGLVEQSRKAVEAANIVCFLGFGYHAENIRPLSVQSGSTGKTIVGTALNLTEAEKRRLNLPQYVDRVEDCTILEFLRRTTVLG